MRVAESSQQAGYGLETELKSFMLVAQRIEIFDRIRVVHRSLVRRVRTREASRHAAFVQLSKADLGVVINSRRECFQEAKELIAGLQILAVRRIERLKEADL